MQQHGIPLYSNGRMFMEGVMNSWLSCMDVKESPANVLLAWNVRPDGTTHFVTAHMEKV